MNWTTNVLRLVCAGACVATAHGQNPLKTLPQNYRLVFENDAVAVIHAHYGAHEKIPVHDHPAVATVFVYLNDSGEVRIDHTGEASVVRPPTVKGSYRVAPGIAETHSIENLGESDSDFLRVELKHVDLKLTEPFRGRAPKSLTESLDAVEFTNPAVEVERVVCVGGTACALKPLGDPSLLVAFTPVVVHSADKPATHLKSGEVLWMPGSVSEDAVQEGADPAHLLRIVLPSRQK